MSGERELDAEDLAGRGRVDVLDLYVQCSLPCGPGAIAASDTCGAGATSAVYVSDSSGGRYMYRCDQHEGIVFRRWSMGTKIEQKGPVLLTIPRRIGGREISNVDQMLAEVINNGERFTITKSGEAVAVVLSYEAWKELVGDGQG